MSRNRNRRNSGSIGGRGASIEAAIPGYSGTGQGGYQPIWPGNQPQGGQGQTGGGGGGQIVPIILDVSLDKLIHAQGLNPLAVVGVHCFSAATGIETLAFAPGMTRTTSQPNQKKKKQPSGGPQSTGNAGGNMTHLAQQVATLSRGQKQLNKQLQRLTSQMGTFEVSTDKQRKAAAMPQGQQNQYAGMTPQLVTV